MGHFSRDYTRGAFAVKRGMIGAIAGDIIGSVYEGRPIKTTAFELFHPNARFTDDTVLTVAVANAILSDRDYAASLKRFGRRYPQAGYGGSFYRWLFSPKSEPYGSWGNGSAMRVSPVGFAFNAVEDVLEEAKTSAAVTHDHPEGIKGARATALAVFLARSGASKEGIKREISGRFGYDLDRRLDEIRPHYGFDVSCQGSVPEAIIAVLEAKGFEDAVRKAVSLGGDSDTQAAIAGGIAEAFYGVPEEITTATRQKLPEDLLSVVDAFYRSFRLR